MKYIFDPKTIRRFERGDRILFFNPEKPAWIVTNSLGEWVLELCDGSRTHSGIVDAFCLSYGEEFREAADRFLVHARESGIFAGGPGAEMPHRPILSLVQLSISSACNLRCVYCYATARQESRHPKMTLGDYHRVVDDLLTLNPAISFTLTGGEPLMNPDCLDIAAFIRARGCRVDLLTNGTLITEKNLARIRELFSRVTVSADGSTPELFNSFRGEGRYDRVERAIGLLEKNGVNHTVSMVVNRKNLHDVENMARKYGGRLNYQPLFRAGSASEGDLGITGAEYYEALAAAHGVNPLSYCESSLDAAKFVKTCKCAVGDGEISISETGDVYPCQLLHCPEFLAGNIHDRPVTAIYADAPSLLECRALSVDNIEGCRDCFLRYVCGGACRARAYHESGSIHVSGDFCEYERRAFVDGIFKLYSRNLMA